MRTHSGKHGQMLALSAVVWLALNPVAQVAAQTAGGTTTGSGSDDPLRALYDDPVRFNRLPGAARTGLEMRFGRRQPSMLGSSLAALVGTSQVGQQSSTFRFRAALVLAAFDNTLVNDPAADLSALDTQSETALTLATNGNIIVGFNDSGSFLFGDHFTGYSVSTDGGASFVDQGTLPDSASGDVGDPVLATDTTSGTIYFTALNFISLFGVESGLQLFRSFDNGITFTEPVNCAPGFGGGDFLDKPWMTVDNFPGEGQGNVYVVFTNFEGGGEDSRPGGIYLTRSTNGGDTWTPNGGRVITNECGQGAYVTVGPDHSVYVFWWDCSAAPQERILMRKSTNFAQNFGPAITVATLNTTGTNGDLGLEFRTSAFPQAAVDPVNGHI